MAQLANTIFALLKTCFGHLRDFAQYIFPFLRRGRKKINICNPVELNKYAIKELVEALNPIQIWESVIRGVVVKCSDEVVLKVVRQRPDYTKYTAMQHLAEKLPEIPVPRPRGVIRFGPFTAFFMSYIPSMTLAEAWPKLDHEGKVSVQNQLEDLFSKLRTLTQDDGYPFGGIGGQGVKEARVSCFTQPEIIDTAKSFEDLQLSLSKFLSKSYIQFFRTLLPPLTPGSVFTHGDVRKDNIMVELKTISARLPV
ncbi:hypothetical protein FQN57_003610 [Myotisia sp. PD_48]|nr:hypothetical protein FQN57_003610 [Myotisia sp. PD_48]